MSQQVCFLWPHNNIWTRSTYTEYNGRQTLPRKLAPPNTQKSWVHLFETLNFSIFDQMNLIHQNVSWIFGWSHWTHSYSFPVVHQEEERRAVMVTEQREAQWKKLEQKAAQNSRKRQWPQGAILALWRAPLQHRMFLADSLAVIGSMRNKPCQ